MQEHRPKLDRYSEFVLCHPWLHGFLFYVVTVLIVSGAKLAISHPIDVNVLFFALPNSGVILAWSLNQRRLRHNSI